MTVDRRVKRSRASLREALLALAEERDIATLTVQEIVDAADVGRATFYVHYTSKEDLLAEVLDELFAELTSASRSFERGLTEGNVELGSSSVINLFELLQRRHGLYRRLLRSGAGQALADRLQAHHEAVFLHIWAERGRTERPGSPSPEFRARYVAAAVRGIMDLWLDQDDPALMSSFGEWTQQMTIHLLSAHTAEDDSSG